MTNPNSSPIPYVSAENVNARAQQPIHSARRLRVICIGAGASGLILAYKLQRSFQNFDLVIYEKNDDISGTWHENRYPGCACDVPAHIYTWSFEPNPNWSSVFAGSKEIKQYFENFCDKYDLRNYIRLKHQVSEAVWNTAKERWDIKISNLTDGATIDDSCDILVNASGVLNVWKWPAISGLEKYKGKLLHTAKWDPSVDLHGKHVGIIGNGSSGIQVLPAIRSQAKKITSFIRSPTWVTTFESQEARAYTDEERQKFATDPNAHIQYRRNLESNMNDLFKIFVQDDAQKKLLKAATDNMKSKLKDERLEKLLMPNWGVGCRRVTPGIGYLEALASEQVDVVFGEIQGINERGCISADGEEHGVDVLICATGFDTSFKPRFPLIGASGKNLSDVWAKEASSYMGIGVADFPNYFVFCGPNSPVGNGPLLVALEALADYMLKMMNRWQTENIRTFAPKVEAIDDFIEFKDKFMKTTVWVQDCNSLYKGDSASEKITALWPGSTLHYLDAVAEPRYEDWDFKYSGNRFAYLGNGFSPAEVFDGGDKAYYIRNEDDGPYLSRSKHRGFAPK